MSKQALLQHFWSSLWCSWPPSRSIVFMFSQLPLFVATEVVKCYSVVVARHENLGDLVGVHLCKGTISVQLKSGTECDLQSFLFNHGCMDHTVDLIGIHI